MPISPVIPEFITVHLGPPDSDAQNVTVSFIDYIKNVASGEIYPNWPESALRANIYAQISFALNKIFVEFYRAKGYDFDITGSTSIDQTYVYGRTPATVSPDGPEPTTATFFPFFCGIEISSVPPAK